MSKARNAGEIAFLGALAQPSIIGRSCMPKAQDAGDVAFLGERTQPSAEIVRVEGAECR